MHAHMRAHMHAHMNAHMHAHMHARMHACTHTHIHARMHMHNARTPAHARMHACTHAHAHACMHACMQVLFLDEPTTGLDAYSSLLLVRALRSLSLSGRTVLCTIHQPRPDIFALFDTLLLMSAGEVSESVSE